MKFITATLAATVLAVVSSLASAIGLQINYLTPDITCTRKTMKGDKLDVHYRGILESTGKEFDSSYSRGRPLNFELGVGRVIKG